MILNFAGNFQLGLKPLAFLFDDEQALHVLGHFVERIAITRRVDLFRLAGCDAADRPS